jgi:F0F1-type ATP synthase membrane subunit c/vacuolar-type H+-ATPase subunit K
VGAIADRARSAASLAEKPELSTTAIILLAIPETMTILALWWRC